MTDRKQFIAAALELAKFDESKIRRDKAGKFAEKDGPDETKETARTAGDLAGGLVGGVIGDKFARAGMSAANARFGINAAAGAARFISPALQIGARLAIGGLAATPAGLAAGALSVAGLEGYRAYQGWNSRRKIKAVETDALSGKITLKQAKQRFMDDGASPQEAGYMVSRIKRMARAEKAFMIGSALGEAEALMKAFDESKHKRDESGKFTEKAGASRLTFGETVGATALMGGAMVGGIMAGPRVGREIGRLIGTLKATPTIARNPSLDTLVSATGKILNAGDTGERIGRNIGGVVGLVGGGIAAGMALAPGASRGRGDDDDDEVHGEMSADMRRAGDLVAARHIERLRREGRLGNDPALRARLASMPGARREPEVTKFVIQAGMLKAWDESAHPRDEDGKFTEKESVSASTRAAASAVSGSAAGLSTLVAAKIMARKTGAPIFRRAGPLAAVAAGAVAAGITALSGNPVEAAARTVGGIAGGAAGIVGGKALVSSAFSPALSRAIRASAKNGKLRVKAERARGITPAAETAAAARAAERDRLAAMPKDVKFAAHLRGDKLLGRYAGTKPVDLAALRQQPYTPPPRDPYSRRSDKIKAAVEGLSLKSSLLTTNVTRGGAIAGGWTGAALASGEKEKK